MINAPVLTTFLGYCVFLTAVGLYFYRKTTGIESYLLGGRSLGAWVTAISAQASDMSGWLLMGLPGALYLGGMPAAWIALGLFMGTLCNWKLVAARLRIYTEATDSITLPTFFERRFSDPSGLLRTLSALITLLFFTIYASSGLVAAGKLFETIFGMDYRLAVVTGLAVIMGYTFLGGFLAVSWTDLFQGALMITAIVAVPIMGLERAGGCAAVADILHARGISLSLLGTGSLTAAAIVSAMSWGLGYFGQPHILARFMGIASPDRIPRAMGIALPWVALSLAGAVAVGLPGAALHQALPAARKKKFSSI
jgi:sodium/proline symporter